MKSVFVHRDPVLVGHALSILTEAGIAAFIRNEASHNILGASIIGPLMAFDPDLCVSDDEDWEPAIELLKSSMIIRRGNVASEWKCTSCGELVPGAFGQCWACETMKEAPESA